MMRFRSQTMRLSNQMTRMRHQIKRRIFKSNDASSNQMMRLRVLPLLNKPVRQILLRSSLLHPGIVVPLEATSRASHDAFVPLLL